jgi:hypothetical protein
MPKIFTDTDKMKWLELYNNGKSEKWIAREVARCDPRTVKRGIDEARRKQDVVIARRELVKDALRKHQDTLFDELDKINVSLYLPAQDNVVLPWQRGGDVILRESETDISTLITIPYSEDTTVCRLLKEHLKNDQLWKVLSQWRKAHTAHLAARTTLQCKVISAIQTKTGYKMIDSNKVPQPFLYSYTTGDLFFRTILQLALHLKADFSPERDITVNTANGDVRYGGLVLGEVPGTEEKTKDKLIEAFRELKGSSEAASVAETYKTLEESITKVRQVIENIKLLGLLPGQCEICKRLGM